MRPELRAVAALAFAFTSLPAAAGGDTLPRVSGVEFQPLSAQVRRVSEALDALGQPLPGPVKAAVEAAQKLPDGAAAVAALQDALDPLCLIGVEINPESRV